MITYSKWKPPQISSASELTKAQEEITRLQAGIAALREPAPLAPMEEV